MSVAEPVKNVLYGAILGMTIILPGFSAATMAVVLGIYDRIIRDISRPSQYLKEDLWFILTIIVVSLIGVYITAKCLTREFASDLRIRDGSIAHASWV